MVNLFRLLLGAVLGVFRARRDLLLENLALRQQLAALKRRQPRSRLTVFDKTFWILAHRFWAGWKQALFLVSPETVVRWHRAGFRCYWSLISKVRKPVGRKPTSKEVRNLLCQMMAENPSWGAPRIVPNENAVLPTTIYSFCEHLPRVADVCCGLRASRLAATHVNVPRDQIRLVGRRE